ncbi:ATP-dependent DNA ligase [Streptomyces sp. DW26H14]|uniref:ATP-dependent DNA ligase n=1 Tax=Streptomyces sp. DW26H14 TaxID=3435395 RepID=UPI00403DBC71
MSWTLPEPALAATVDSAVLPRGFAAEPKWDGYRALLDRGEHATIFRSRRGTSLALAFPEVAARGADLPPGTALDGELVIWENDRLAFERLQHRMNRRAATVAQMARATPAHFVVFDLLRLRGDDFTGRPYTERRAALESLFADEGLGPPWTLCPSTTDPAVAESWLEWGSVGLEGLVFKRLSERYPAGRRAWRKYRARASTEAIVGAVTGRMRRPSSVLLGRLDVGGYLRYAGRTVPLAAQAAERLAPLLAPPAGGHPWTGWSFSAGWGTRETLDVTLVDPAVVVEVSADVALDAAGRWRHPVRLLRTRADMALGDVAQFGEALS